TQTRARHTSQSSSPPKHPPPQSSSSLSWKSPAAACHRGCYKPLDPHHQKSHPVSADTPPEIATSETRSVYTPHRNSEDPAGSSHCGNTSADNSSPALPTPNPCANPC